MDRSSPAAAWDAARTRLRESPAFARLVEGGGEIVRLPAAAAAWVLGEVAAVRDRSLLVVVPHESEIHAWVDASALFRGEGSAIAFPAPALSPYQEAEVSLHVRADEALAVDRLVRRFGSGRPEVVVTTPRALYRRLPDPDLFATGVVELETDGEAPPARLAEHLLRWGYRRSDLVFEVGQMAVRGGVFDVWPPGQERPVRLDLFGDTIESIFAFDPSSQRSEDALDRIRVLPLSLYPCGPDEAEVLAERLLERAGPSPDADTARSIAALRNEGGFPGWEHLLPLVFEDGGTLADLLDDPWVATLDLETLATDAAHWAETLEQDFDHRARQGRLAIPPDELEHSSESVDAILLAADVRVGDLVVSRDGALDFAATTTEILHDQLPRFPREVETARSRGDRVVLVAPASHRRGLEELLESQEIPLGGGGVDVVDGDLDRGFRLPAAGVTIFGERQILRRSPIARRRAAGRKKPRYGAFVASLRDLKTGDYVVHTDHGIGQFVGLRHLGGDTGPADLPPELREAAPTGASQVEVMEIRYASGRSLLLPLSRLDQIQKYSGIEGLAPRLDRLGGSSWTKTKSRIKKGLRSMAGELLKLYAEREMARAPAMEPDGDLEEQFARAFEYDETQDQLEAIGEIASDLESRKPMDRLLCGDVGFGKTEVSMRAALKVVASGYQVALLAPTTILADQHLETFRARFDGFPVSIEMISRFRSNAEVREIRRRLKEGKLDIVVGTHRLLAGEVEFAKLGLVIIDEEQRFGVAHKERLKKLRKDVHVLAMSATPVPRTLQLSLAGVRDLSLIETPPRDRMAVETAILPFDAQWVREAIEHELARGGQIYYVYNRVETIERMAEALREILPTLRITVGHGQLDEGELAKRMHAFVAGEHDLLLATTIIENGIDIPNVNTIIVHRADRFGLSQLYQLRGRVGRSDQLAYCYLLVPSDRVLSQEARKRLDAIREFTELGAGFRVAGRDLEIRGAGDLLGAEQSGHIAAVGIETYLKMLEETVAELRGEKPEEAPSVALDLPVATTIPEDYVGDENLRMEIYRRLATGDEERDALVRELRDRFGPPPDGVLALLEASELKRRAEEMRLQAISARDGRLVLRMRQDARLEPDRLIQLLSTRPGVRFSPSGALTVDDVPTADVLATAREVLEFLASPPEGTGASEGAS